MQVIDSLDLIKGEQGVNFTSVNLQQNETTLAQYGKVNDIDHCDGVDDISDGFRRGCYALDGPDGALCGKSVTAFIDEELFLKWDVRTYIK